MAVPPARMVTQERRGVERSRVPGTVDTPLSPEVGREVDRGRIHVRTNRAAHWPGPGDHMATGSLAVSPNVNEPIGVDDRGQGGWATPRDDHPEPAQQLDHRGPARPARHPDPTCRGRGRAG